MWFLYFWLAIIWNYSTWPYLPLHYWVLLLLIQLHSHCNTDLAISSHLLTSLALTYYCFTHVPCAIEIDVIRIHYWHNVPWGLYYYLMINWVVLPKFIFRFHFYLMRHLSIYIAISCCNLFTRIVIIPRIHHIWLFYIASLLTFGWIKALNVW